MVHATFTWGGSEVKAARLRETGLWALDPASYFSCCQPQPAGIDSAAADAAGSGGSSGVQPGTEQTVAEGGDGSGMVGSSGATDGSGSGGSVNSRFDSMRFVTQPHTGASGFLTYDNTVDAAVAAAADQHLQRKGRKMADLHMHLTAAAYQLAALRDAWAVAR